MKKLQLKALELGAREVLTRAQLKNVLGGSGSGSVITVGPAPSSWNCNATNSKGEKFFYSVPEDQKDVAQSWYNAWSSLGGNPTCELVQSQWA